MTKLLVCMYFTLLKTMLGNSVVNEILRNLTCIVLIQLSLVMAICKHNCCFKSQYKAAMYTSSSYQHPLV